MVRCSRLVTLALLLMCFAGGCGQSGRDSGSGGASNGGASSGGGAGDAGADVVTPNTDGCQKAGGQCGCAGGCPSGFHLAPAPLTWQCPQPCDQCGACSQECCLPDDAGASGPCGAGVCVAPNESCPSGMTLTQMGCPLDAELGSCCQ